MIRLVMLASLLVGCRIALENDTTGDDDTQGRVCAISMSPACVEAANGNHADLAFLEENVFKPGCAFSECHDGRTGAQGKIDLRSGQSHAHLVDFASAIDPTRKLVVPNDVHASYLMLMLRDFPPGEATPPGQAPPDRAGYMPMSSAPLCCQKMDAIERWILAGAPSN
jgi:hypothetical protein